MERTKKQESKPEVIYDNFQEPVVLSKGLIDRLKGHEKFSDLLALYVFYYYTAKWQQTNRPKATTGYTATGLKWSETRVRQAKQILIDLKLIKDITTRDANNHINGHFIHVRFVWSSAVTKERIFHPNDFPPSGEFHPMEPSGINALNNNREYKKNKQKSFLETPKFIKAWHEWKEYKLSDHKFKYTIKGEHAAKKHLGRLSKENETTAICIIEQSIANGWAGLFPLKDTKNNKTGYKPSNGHVDLEVRKTYKSKGQI